MRPVEVVEVLPLPETLGEQARLVDHDAIEKPVELVGVDAVRAFELSVEAGRRRPDVHVADPPVEHVVVEAGLELSAIVGLDGLDPER